MSTPFPRRSTATGGTTTKTLKHGVVGIGFLVGQKGAQTPATKSPGR